LTRKINEKLNIDIVSNTTFINQFRPIINTGEATL